jgi:quercetin dioxygenase-like cupin family protein/DNA-binding Xre family transcriptional regulator
MSRGDHVKQSDKAAVAEEPMPTGIGARLRALRASRGLSLAQVAEGTDISKSFLSLVEAGRSDITIGRLMRIVEFFGITVNELLAQDAGGQVTVTRAESRRVLSSPSEGIDDLLLIPDAQRAMMPFIAVFSPGGSNSEHATHEGEEFGYVIEGEFILDIKGQEPIVLRPGDSVYFPASHPHAYRNASDGESRLLCVVTPPHM